MPAASSKTEFAAAKHNSTPTEAEDVRSPSGLTTEHRSVASIIKDVSYPLAAVTEHGSGAMLAEDLFEVLIPFLTTETPAYFECGAKKTRIPILITAEHVHVWCDRCVVNFDANFERSHASTHDACPDCRILRTIMQLSRRWFEFIWDDAMWNPKPDGSFTIRELLEAATSSYPFWLRRPPQPQYWLSDTSAWTS